MTSLTRPHMTTAPDQATGLGRLHALLGVQSVIVILLSINRLSTLTLGYVLPNEFLRWVDFNNMLLLPLASVIASYLLKKDLERGAVGPAGRGHLALNLAFLVGVYLLAASYGDHEVTNYLHARFCADVPGAEMADLCRIVIFNDDEFSHWVFFAGFVLINGALLLMQAVLPDPRRLTLAAIALLMLNGLFIGAGIFANLAFEVIGLDLYVVALLAALSLALLWRRGRQPLFVYYSTAYTLGLVATFLYKAFAA
jgi:hypothetical protein